MSSPSTRSRAAVAAGTQQTVTADVHGDPTKKKSSRKGSEASSDRGSSRSRMVVKSATLDIPNIIMRMMERLAKGEQPADVAKDMPTGHKQWKERSVRNHVKHLKAKLQPEHWLALDRKSVV